MQEPMALKPRFIISETGEREAVVLSIAEWEAIQHLLGEQPGSDDVLKALEAEGISLSDLKVCR